MVDVVVVGAVDVEVESEMCQEDARGLEERADVLAGPVPGCHHEGPELEVREASYAASGSNATAERSKVSREKSSQSKAAVHDRTDPTRDSADARHKCPVEKLKGALRSRPCPAAVTLMARATSRPWSAWSRTPRGGTQSGVEEAVYGFEDKGRRNGEQQNTDEGFEEAHLVNDRRDMCTL